MYPAFVRGLLSNSVDKSHAAPIAASANAQISHWNSGLAHMGCPIV
jgi:hypothetical protein